MDNAPSRRAWLLAALPPCLALVIFRPWVRQPFAVWDYPDVLPILRRTPGVWNGTMAIASFNRPDGRACYLSYFQFGLTWGLAGGDPVGWQLQRALFMLTAAILLVAVSRRFGATPLAAAAAATLFAVSVPATEGWLFLAAEPLSTVLLLLIVLTAAGYSTTPAWRLRGVLLALLAALVMLSKEVHGLCLPVLMIFAVTWEPGRGFRLPRIGARERWLAALLLIVLVLEAWSVRSALHDGVAGNYASAFGRSGINLGRAVTLFQAMLLPARFSSAGTGTVLYPANLAFLGVLLAGLLLLLTRPAGARRSGWLFALGLLSFPVVGALTYGLWPRYSAFYGIPFFAGSAGLFLLAATELERRFSRGRLLVAVLGVITIFFTAIVAQRTAGQKWATADLAARVSRSLASSPRLDTLFVVAPRQGGRRWPVNARELRHYGLFLGVSDSLLPITQDATCEELIGRLRSPLGRNGVLNDQNPCGRLPARTTTWLSGVAYLDWLSMGKRTDTMWVDLLAPSWSAVPAKQ